MAVKGRLLRRLFFGGLVFLLPIALTLYVCYSVFRWIYGGLEVVTNLLPEPYRHVVASRIVVVVASVVLLLALTVLLGALMRTVFGRAVERVVDRAFHIVPGIKGLYAAFKQFLDLVVRRRDDGALRPVLVEYPHKGKWAVAFLTGDWDPRLAPRKGTDYCTVFMPTTPNPTTGFLMIVPAADVRPLDMDVNETLRLILSGGIVK